MYSKLLVAFLLMFCWTLPSRSEELPKIWSDHVEDVRDFSPAELLRPKRLTISRISANFIQPMDRNVTEVDLAGFEIQVIEKKVFDMLPNLWRLNLKKNAFPLSEFLVNGHKNLVILLLDHNSYENFSSRIDDPVMIGEFPKLHHLSLSSCRLRSLLASKDNLPSLINLDLSNNLLSHDRFEWLPESLEYLDLNENLLQVLTLRALRNLKYLSICRLSKSGIEKVTLEYLPSLTILFATHNRLTDMKAFRVKSLPNLRHLELSDNDMTYIDTSIIDNFPNLVYLNIANNAIKVIEPNTFNKMSNLRYLGLKNNSIERLDKFDVDLQLETLYLDTNLLTHLEERAFYRMPNLRILNLDNNYIFSMHENSFGGLVKLYSIALSNNQMRKMPQNWMLPMKSLESAYLKHNHFSDMTDLSLSKTSPIRVLYVSQLLNSEPCENLPQNLTIYMGRMKIVKANCSSDILTRDFH